MNKKEYSEYLSSDKWKIRRQEAIDASGGKCQLCGNYDELIVHHNSYINLGNELPTDLIALCHRCHDCFHLLVCPKEVIIVKNKCEKRYPSITNKEMKIIIESVIPKYSNIVPDPLSIKNVSFMVSVMINDIPGLYLSQIKRAVSIWLKIPYRVKYNIINDAIYLLKDTNYIIEERYNHTKRRYFYINKSFDLQYAKKILDSYFTKNEKGRIYGQYDKSFSFMKHRQKFAL